MTDTPDTLKLQDRVARSICLAEHEYSDTNGETPDNFMPLDWGFREARKEYTAQATAAIVEVLRWQEMSQEIPAIDASLSWLAREPKIDLRDWFAGLALSSCNVVQFAPEYEELTKRCYMAADAMLKAREDF